MQNLSCRNVLNVKFPKNVAEKFAFYNFRLALIYVSLEIIVVPLIISLIIHTN